MAPVWLWFSTSTLLQGVCQTRVCFEISDNFTTSATVSKKLAASNLHPLAHHLQGRGHFRVHSYHAVFPAYRLKTPLHLFGSQIVAG
jgi:hypothetical protein